MLHFPRNKNGDRIKLKKGEDNHFRDTFTQVMKQTKQTVRSSKSKFEAIGWYYTMKYFLFGLF